MPDPCFLFSTYKDELLAKRLIVELRTAYPEADIICLGDGRLANGFGAFCEAHGVIVERGKRLKLMATGGQWCDRVLQAFFNYSLAEVLIKLDPDSRLHRPFKHIPQADWFGDVRLDGFFRPLIRGGCMGFSRDFAKRLLLSRLLENQMYDALPFGYLRYSTFLREGEARSEEWVSFTDGILADAAFRLRVAPTQWDEVCIKFRDPLPADTSPYAVTHPHATL